MIKVSVVILNYNGIKDTVECLESLSKLKISSFKLELIVVDNNSHDKTQEVLKERTEIILIKNSQNYGYAKGNNIGIKKALKGHSDFVLILNNDTIVDPNLIENLLKSAKFADIICPKIYFAKGFEFHKSKYQKEDLGKVIWYAGGFIDWDNIIGIHSGVDEVDNAQYDNEREIQFATGACMFVKKDVFEKIGFFDEKYFLYLEDMDYCYRATNAYFKILYQPKAIIWHKNAASAGGSGSKLQDYYFTRNRLLFTFKFAKLKTKLNVLKQVVSQINNPVKRQALFDFLLFRFGGPKII